MPTYDYKCGTCGAVREVVHAMAELDNPSPATLAEISCCPVTVGDYDKPASARPERVRMHRIITQAPALGTIAGMSPTQRREVLKKRSQEHFKKEIAPVKEQMNKDFITKGRAKFGLA